MQCAICGTTASHVCGRSGRPVCSEHSRIEVVSRLSFGSSGGLSVREALQSDYENIGKLAEYFQKGTNIACFDKNYDLLKLPAYLVSANDHPSGVLSYSIEPESLVIVMLDVLPGYQGLGAGRMLLDAANSKAAEAGKTDILVAATNDDLPSIYFYQRNGFQIYDVKPGLAAARDGAVKVGFAGIPRRDEIRMRHTLEG